jgi:hypothetical protein
MQRKNGSVMSDHEMIRAYHREQRDCELNHDVGWITKCWPDDKRSVINIRLEAWEVGDPYAEGAPLAAFETSWPNAQVYSFTACLFNAAVKLTRLVEDSLRDRQRQRER